MLKMLGTKYILSLMLVGVSCSCTSTKESYSITPIFPIGGEKVGEELKTIPYEGYEDMWEWIGRLHKLKMELDEWKKQLK
jgi:hypothetical protein